MEIIKNRYNQDRVIEKLSTNKIRIMGESLFSRTSKDESDNLIMFDFEGGPCVTLGSKFRYLQTDWVINKITQEPISQANLLSVLLDVELSN
jgi:hypothetical protein